MVGFLDILMIALFIEAIVNALKPIWKGEGQLTVTEYVSMFIGILIAVTCKINILSYVMELDIIFPVWVQYVFYAMSGIAIGRGTTFLYDLWNKLLEWKNGDMIANGFLVPDNSETVDVEVTNWSLTQLKDFCALNGVDATGCTTREDYINAIGKALIKETEPPEMGAVE